MDLRQSEIDELFKFIKDSNFYPTSHEDNDGNSYNVTAIESDGHKTITFTDIKTLSKTTCDDVNGIWEVI